MKSEEWQKIQEELWQETHFSSYLCISFITNYLPTDELGENPILEKYYSLRIGRRCIIHRKEINQLIDFADKNHLVINITNDEFNLKERRENDQYL
jgi:hypothetical protein